MEKSVGRQIQTLTLIKQKIRLCQLNTVYIFFLQFAILSFEYFCLMHPTQKFLDRVKFSSYARDPCIIVYYIHKCKKTIMNSGLDFCWVYISYIYVKISNIICIHLIHFNDIYPFLTIKSKQFKKLETIQQPFSPLILLLRHIFPPPLSMQRRENGGGLRSLAPPPHARTPLPPKHLF